MECVYYTFCLLCHHDSMQPSINESMKNIVIYTNKGTYYHTQPKLVIGVLDNQDTPYLRNKYIMYIAPIKTTVGLCL